MDLSKPIRPVCLAVLPAVLLGCGPSQPPPAAHKPPTTVKVKELPELGEPMPALDEGRIVVARPAGWHVPPRKSGWIVRFTASRQASYPSIIVTGEDYEPVFNVSKQNVADFAEQIRADFRKTSKIAGLRAPVEPITFGSFVGITYQRRGKAKYEYKTIVVERLFVETVVAGRKYCFELRTRTGTLSKYRPYLLAVAGGAEFPKTEPAEPYPSGGEPRAEPQPEPEAVPKETTPKGPAEPETEFESIEEDQLD